MSTSSHTPIRFTLASNTSDDYHKVRRHELAGYMEMDNDTLTRCVEELNARVNFSRRYYHGRYDHRHMNWMQTLARPLKLRHKLDLSLDALVVMQRRR
jgi:hypothetical protein